MRPSDSPVRRALRLVLSIDLSRVRAWREVATTGAPLRGKPAMCPCCPLRAGGEWDATKLDAVPTPVIAAASQRWWCHKDDRRPCAGLAAYVAKRSQQDQA